MDEVDREQLYNVAWEHWGSRAQLDILIEEMAELTQAILKARRGGTTFTQNVYEELADVLICVEQLKTQLEKIATPDGSTSVYDEVIRIRDKKIDKFLEILIDDIARCDFNVTL